jgi:hypothetical protein
MGVSIGGKQAIGDCLCRRTSRCPIWPYEEFLAANAVGDCDAVTLEHAVRFLQMRGGDVNGDFVGVPSSQLAVFPGTTHFFGMARTALVLDVVTTFLDTPEAAS